MKVTETKRKVNLYIAAIKEDWSSNFAIEVSTYDRSKWTHDTTTVVVPLSAIEVEVPIPDVTEKQLVAEEVKQLQAMIQKEKADSHVRVTAIEEKIQSLMCIENDSH